MKRKKVIEMDKEKHRPIVYAIYNYFKACCSGYENRQKSYEIMAEFGIKNNEMFRSFIAEIRQSSTLMKFVGSQAGKSGGYWIAENYDEVDMTLEHLLRRAMEMLKTYSILRKKARLDGQRRIKFSKYEKDIYKSLGDE